MCKHLKQDYSLSLQILCQNEIYMKKYPCVLSIAGSDCSGGAGIQADLKTISALGGYAATAITAITVQNTLGVRAIHPVPPVYVRGQIEAVMEDIRPDAVKIGMINDVEIVMPLASLITPNLSEAEVLTEHRIGYVDEMKAAASELLKFGCGSVLLKGGHLEGDKMCDVLQIVGEDKPHLFISDKIESKNTHGTGCTLSSAIATFLALGYDMPQAVEHAKAYVTKGIHAGKDVHIGEGHGPLNHFYAPVPMKIMK